jgi:hypothetical protein
MAVAVCLRLRRQDRGLANGTMSLAWRQLSYLLWLWL